MAHNTFFLTGFLNAAFLSGIFDSSGHWDITVEYAKTDHLGLACQIEAVNNGSQAETIHLIPQFLFRFVVKNSFNRVELKNNDLIY